MGESVVERNRQMSARVLTSIMYSAERHLPAQHIGDLSYELNQMSHFAEYAARDGLRLLAFERVAEGRHLLKLGAEAAEVALREDTFFQPTLEEHGYAYDDYCARERGIAVCMEAGCWERWARGEGMDFERMQGAAQHMGSFYLRHHRRDSGAHLYGPILQRYVIAEDYVGAFEWMERAQAELRHPGKLNVVRGTGIASTLLRICRAALDGGREMVKVRKAAERWYRLSQDWGPVRIDLLTDDEIRWVYIWNRYFGGLTDPLDVLRDWRGF